MKDMLSLSELFNKKLFRIPDYQRGYAWEKQQVEDFWNDLMLLHKDKEHYTGMLSLQEIRPKLDDVNYYDCIDLRDTHKIFHIVDGQQRLTTSMLLINQIIKIDYSKYEPSIFNNKFISSIKGKYICNNKCYVFGYEVDNPSFVYLKNIFGESDPTLIKESRYTRNLSVASHIFEENLKKLIKDKGVKAVEDLFYKLTEKLQFNIHYIKHNFDVHVAFETMNNRGKKLSNLEILKNRLIYLSTLYPDSKKMKAKKLNLQKEINDAWKEIYYNLGKDLNNELDDDMFLKAHWALYFKFSKTDSDTYVNELLNKYFIPAAVNDFIREYNDSELDEDDIDWSDDALTIEEISSYVKSLRETSKYYYDTFVPNPKLSEEEQNYIRKLNRIGIGYSALRNLVVASYLVSKDKDASFAEKRIELFKAIERFIFLCFRTAGFQSSYKSGVYYRYAGQMLQPEGNLSIDAVIEDINKTVDDDMPQIIQSFITQSNGWFSENNHYGFYAWTGLKYFLFEYEESLLNASTGTKISGDNYFKKSEKDKVSIEHIFPQTPSKYYWANLYRSYDKDNEVWKLAGTIGNLLPLSSSINSSLQNDSFEAKVNGRKGAVGYEMNSYSAIEVSKHHKWLEEDYPSFNKYYFRNIDETEFDWTPEKIERRGIHLLKFLSKRYNCPLTDEDIISLLHIDFIHDEIRQALPPLEKYDDDVFEITSQKGYNVDRVKYWTAFEEYCEGLGYGFMTTYDDPSERNYFDLRYQEDFNYVFKVNRNGIEFCLYCYTPTVYSKMASIKNELEEALGCEFVWDLSKANSLAKRISLFKDIDYSKSNNWDECFEWYIECFNSIKDILLLHFPVKKQSGTMSVDEHLLTKPEKMSKIYKEIYGKVKDKISDFYEVATNPYIAFRTNKNDNFAEIWIQRSQIKVMLRSNEVGYPVGSKVGDSYRWTHNWRIALVSEKQIDEVVVCILISYYSIDNNVEMMNKIKDNINHITDFDLQQSNTFERGEVFSFVKCGIPAGAELEYIYDPSIKCTVYDERKINYNGEIMYMTTLVKQITKIPSPNGPSYFSYNGKNLSEYYIEYQSKK